MSITNPNKPVTKQDLKDFYDKILPYLGGSGGGGGSSSITTPKIPNMTSNTTPSGEASASSTYTNQPAYKAFNGIANDPWAMASGDSNPWLQYSFGQPIKATAIGYDFYTVPERVTSFSVYGDGNLITTITGPITSGFHKVDLPSDKQGNYSVYKLTFVATGLVHVDTFQLYAEQEVSNPCNYSTDEQLIGTWISGKPLYQKTLSLTTPSTNALSTVYSWSGAETLIDRLVELKGFVDWQSESNAFNVPIVYVSQGSSTALNLASCYTNSDGIRCQVNGDFLYNKPLYLTIQYTKSTD